MKRAVFLDRDGTVLNERGYLSDPGKIKFYPFAVRALKKLRKAGFTLVIVTNQSGVGRGYFNLTTLAKVHARFRQKLNKAGVRLGGIYFCPHRPDRGCACRKPRPGMLKKAAKDLKIDLKNSYVVGDQARDVEMAHRAKAKGVLVLTGAGRSVRRQATRWAHKITTNLETATQWIINDIK